MHIEYTGAEILKLIKPRKENSSKGDFGSLTMLCGCETMTGAAVMSAYGALRSGLGLLHFSGNEETIKRIQTILFEPVYLPVENIWEKKHTAFLCGCGIGRTYDDILTRILEQCSVPAILDADCINFLSRNINVLGRMKCEKILTPHPAEMSRLCGKPIDEIQASRTETARDFARAHNCILLLKGQNTVIAAPDGRISINTSGSSALAKGGSGDVLAGVIASLAAQGYEPYDAARLGAYVHGLAAENLSVKLGKSGVLPSDLPMEIGRLLG